jgi:hypothetical protein
LSVERSVCDWGSNGCAVRHTGRSVQGQTEVQGPGGSNARAIQRHPIVRHGERQVTAGAHRLAATTPTGPGLPAAIFDFSRGKQALLTVAQPALGAR